MFTAHLTKTKTTRCATIAAARDAIATYAQQRGSTAWLRSLDDENGAQIIDESTGRAVALVSYNGRLWAIWNGVERVELFIAHDRNGREQLVTVPND